MDVQACLCWTNNRVWDSSFKEHSGYTKEQIILL